ncbi:hypothetical protein BDV26DRAFT_260542 [Aspergillus bertholletiae]|uniref:Uncharacterized protein n=1 Tax=Aspergillus bertholletiae TaxID=1226010 RepID=A0A5N7BAX6_9EURO|nr:hypothetical protein BDV26DRAFT_260542 [Aspergillus bertholletiae]
MPLHSYRIGSRGYRSPPAEEYADESPKSLALSAWNSILLDGLIPCDSTYMTTQSIWSLINPPPTCYHPLRDTYSTCSPIPTPRGGSEKTPGVPSGGTTQMTSSRRQLGLTRLSDQQTKNVTIVSVRCATVHVRQHAVPFRGTLGGTISVPSALSLGASDKQLLRARKEEQLGPSSK